MTPEDEMATVLAKIDAWLREKEYAAGHRTGELLKEAATEIRRLKKRVQELERVAAMAVRPMERCGLVATADQIKSALFGQRSGA